MAGERGQTLRNFGGRRRKQDGGVRSGLRCVLIPCMTFAVVLGASSILRCQLFGCIRETPSVRGAGEVQLGGIAEEGEGGEAPASAPAPLPLPMPALAPGPVVAYAISVTSLEFPKAKTMLDSAEVLINSIRKACGTSRYRCDFVAFALPSVGQEGRRHLEGMGWRIIEKNLPVALEDIENETYRKFVVNSGCCGANEFIKLHAYTLTDYHRVVHLDADTLILHHMDELMESEASLVYTTDPAMATKGSKAMPVQGGFLLVRPDLGVYYELCAIVREGNWRIGAGWGDSNIGYFYGGATVQGLLPYYYNIVAPGTAMEVNRCIYNHMSDSDECRSERYTLIARGEEEGTEARARKPRVAITQSSKVDTGVFVPGVSAIKSVHFTQSCTKPWFCPRVTEMEPNERSCRLLQQAWRDGRRDIMEARGLPLTPACSNGGYLAIPRS